MIDNWESYEPKIIPDIPNLHEIDVYEENNGYQALRSILEDQEKWAPDEVTNEVKSANIRGRGGAGVNAGLRWSFIPDPDDRPRCLACDSVQAGPRTLSDRSMI